MNRVFCGFSDTEYEKIQNKAKELGMSIPKLVEYATTIYVNSPRKQITNLQNIQERIQNFIAQENVNEFICSDPFDNWEFMTISEKRTAAAQIRKLVDTGIIEKVNPETKSHRAAVYKKTRRNIKTMWKSGTFGLEDINAALIDEIVFFDISYPGMEKPGCVIFITESGNEYIISQYGTEWEIVDIIKLFPDMYEVYQNQKSGTKDEYGFVTIGNWKIIPAFAGCFLVRMDYFGKFYSKYKMERETEKKFPCGIARLLFGRERYAPDERMVYIKTQECWDQDLQKEILRKQEIERNCLSDTDAPWMKYNSTREGVL